MQDALEQLGVSCLVLSHLAPEISFMSLWWCGSNESGGINSSTNSDRMMHCVGRLGEATPHEFDLVYTNCTTCPLGAFFAAYYQLPHVWHLREFVDRDFGWTFFMGKRETYALIEALSHEVIVNSELLRQEVFQLIQNVPINTVANGPLADAWLEDPARSMIESDATLKLCHVGTIIEHKGQRDAVEAVSELQRRGVPCELHLYGEAERTYQQDLKKIVDSLAISKHVHFHGITKDPRAAFCDHHIALVCSRYEAFGRVTVEAMATARPVVAANAGATSQIIEDGVTGLLYSAGDPGDLANCIERLWRDRSFAQNMASHARDHVLKLYSRQHYATQVEGILRRAATKSSAHDTSPDLLRTIARDVCKRITSHARRPTLYEQVHGLKRSCGGLLTKAYARILPGR